MCSSRAVRALFICVVLGLIQDSLQQELFEDAVELENADPMLGNNFFSPAEENDVPDEGTSLTANTPLEPPYGDPSAQENGEESSQPQFYDSPEHSYVDSEGYYVNNKGIDGGDKVNMEQEEDQNGKYDNSIPIAETMSDINEQAVETSDKMTGKPDRHDNEYVVNDNKLKMKDTNNQEDEREQKDRHITDNGNVEEEKMKSKSESNNNLDAVFEKPAVVEPKDDQSGEEKGSLKKETENVAPETMSDINEQRKQTSSTMPERQNLSDNENDEKKEKSKVKNENEEDKLSEQNAEVETKDEQLHVKQGDSSTIKNTEHFVNMDTSKAKSENNKKFESLGKESDQNVKENAQDTEQKVEELPATMPSETKLKSIYKKEHKKKSTEIEDQNANNLPKADTKSDANENADKEQQEKPSKAEKVLAQKDNNENDFKERSPNMEQVIPLDYAAKVTDNPGKGSNSKVEEEEEKDKEKQHTSKESTEDNFNRQSNQDITNLEEQKTVANLNQKSGVSSERQSQSEFTIEGSGSHEKSFEELITKERREKQEKSSGNVLSTLEDVEKGHSGKQEKEIAKENKSMENQETSQGNALSTLEDVKERPSNEHELDLSTLPDAQAQKHQAEKNKKQFFENLFEERKNNKRSKKHSNVLDTLPDVKRRKMSKNEQANEDIHKIFEEQNFDNISLEEMNGTAYGDDVTGIKLNLTAQAHGDDISGLNNKSLPSGLDLKDKKNDKDLENNDRTLKDPGNNGGEIESGDNSDSKPADDKQDKTANDNTVKRMENIEKVSESGNSNDGSGSAKPADAKQIENEVGETENGEVVTANSDSPSKDNPVVVVPNETITEESEQSASGENTELNQQNNNQIGVDKKDNHIKAEDGEPDSGGEDGVEASESDDANDETSGAERERRQAFTTEEEVNKAKAKLKNAVGASDALTSIEKEMGLDPAIAPTKTKNLTSALHSEIDKFKDMISKQDDSVKKSKFHKLEKLAEEDVKGANDVMKMIVELEVAKFFAKHRARKKLELAMRNKISTPPVQNQQAPDLNAYQAMTPNYMQFQDQAYAAPYAPYPQQAAFAPLPSFPQAPSQLPAQPPNPLQGRFMDNNAPPSWNPQMPAFVAPQRAPQDYSPYIGTPMNLAPANMYQGNPQPLPAYPSLSSPIQSKAVNYAMNENANNKPPQQQPKVLNDEPLKIKADETLPKFSPFAGLKPLSLSSFKPIQAVNPSFNTEMKSQSAPFSSLKQDSFTASSLHPFADDVSPPPAKPNVQQFFPQSAWVAPARVNTFSDSLSHLNLNYQKPATSSQSQVNSQPQKLPSTLVNSRTKPLTTHKFHPEPQSLPPMQQQYYDVNPSVPRAPPMYPQFQLPAPMEPVVPVQQFSPPTQFYPQSSFANQPPPMPYMGAPLSQQQPSAQFTGGQREDEKLKTEENPMNLKLNDEPMQQPQSLPYQGQQVYPQQQAINGYNAYSTPAVPSWDSYSWPQSSYTQGYGYQPSPSYEQLVNPLLSEAITKIHDTKKAAQVVQKIENTIGLSPPDVSHIIDDVESETKNEKTQFDQQVKEEEEKIHNDKKMMDEVPDNESLKKKINDEKEKLEQDRKRENIAKAKLETIKKIEKILTVIETAKYSALKRAKEHLMRLKSEKDPQIRKRSLEELERDLHHSEQKHLHRRNEINIWLKGSKNSINTSHFLEGEKAKKEKAKRKFNVFGSPSVPKLEIAKFAANFAKKANISLPKMASKKNKIPKPKRKKIGVVLMKKLLQRMDDLYDMQSKILTQLIKDHQRVQDEKERMRTRRSIKKRRHHNVHTRHLQRHNLHHSKR